jgi:hypothetical protein
MPRTVAPSADFATQGSCGTAELGYGESTHEGDEMPNPICPECFRILAHASDCIYAEPCEPLTPPSIAEAAEAKAEKAERQYDADHPHDVGGWS